MSKGKCSFLSENIIMKCILIYQLKVMDFTNLILNGCQREMLYNKKVDSPLKCNFRPNLQCVVRKIVHSKKCNISVCFVGTLIISVYEIESILFLLRWKPPKQQRGKWWQNLKSYYKTNQNIYAKIITELCRCSCK